MFLACGLSLYSVAIFHLVNHAFFKAALFLLAGGIIHGLNDEQDIRRMGGLINLLPLTYILTLINILTLVGFPFLSAYYSKDLIIEYLYFTHSELTIFIYIIVICTIIGTTLYSSRFLYLIFFTKINAFRSTVSRIKEINIIMGIPIILLTFFSVLSGYLFVNTFVYSGNKF